MYSSGFDLTSDSVASNGAVDFWNNLAAASAGFIVLFIILGFIALGLVIFLIVCECKMFKKAGESWWKALIPVYSTWVEAKIAGLAWWWCPIMLGLSALTTFKNLSYVAGFALIVISFNFFYNISKKFGKSNGFALLCTILPIIGLPILAFGSAKYDKDVKVDENGVFSLKK